MTVIEFFSGVPMENMISSFSLKPEKVIFLGDGRRMRARVRAYAEMAKRLGISADFEFRSVAQNSLDKVCDALIEIVEAEKDCCFDLTGGSEIALVALGKVFQTYGKERRLQMVRFNVSTGRMTDCDNDGENPVLRTDLTLGGAECIELHGGRVTRRTVIGDLKDADDVDRVWEVCRSKPLLWNAEINALGELLSLSFSQDGGRRAVVDKRRCLGVPDFNGKLEGVIELLNALSAKGLAADIKETERELSFEYKNTTVKRCLSKAGNVLELKTLLLASRLRDKSGAKVYCDCSSGVVIDWDGEETNGFAGTVNEIDLVLMRGFVPVFVSCKNGGVSDDELYKLSSVADTFGGKYAKKALIVTKLNKSPSSRSYFLRRAEDMGISVIEGVYKMSDCEFAERLMKLV